jgi:hypothetical protein
MQDEPNDSSRDVPEGDRSELDTGVAEPHLTIFMFKLDLETKKKLGCIMENEDHFVFTDTVKMLIDLEYDRIQESRHADL